MYDCVLCSLMFQNFVISARLSLVLSFNRKIPIFLDILNNRKKEVVLDVEISSQSPKIPRLSYGALNCT